MTNFFLQALAEVGTPSVLGLIVIGVLFGIIGGSIPGFPSPWPFWWSFHSLLRWTR